MDIFSAMLIPGQIRPEYNLIPLFYIIRFIVLRSSSYLTNNSNRISITKISLIFVFVVLIGTTALSFDFVRGRVHNYLSHIDGYLFFGLSQCYTRFMTADNPNPGFSDFGEPEVVMEKVFPSANGFLDALIVNPLEIARYFFLNGLSNVLHIHRLIQQHSVFCLCGWIFLAVVCSRYYFASEL